MIKEGWMGKYDFEALDDNDFRRTDYGEELKATVVMYKDKGTSGDWDAEQWPPVRVRVTIEMVEER